MKRVGRSFWARDYQEFVEVVRVERRGRYTILRRNGSQTFNYPADLLSSKPPSTEAKA